jgi:predicted acylesterase/phospholipase RssA
MSNDLIPTQHPSRTEHTSETSKLGIVLSAGYFGFFAHAGFMLAIEELGINYDCIAGSSAGAIVAALHATGVPAADIISLLTGVSRKDFWDSTGLSGVVRGLLRRGRGWTGLLKGDRFEKMIRQNLRVACFEESPKALFITAFNLTRRQEQTFSTGTIADKVRASCSYPFLIQPATIDGEQYWDGGFLSKVPLEMLVQKENPDRLLIHYLPSSDGVERQFRDWTAVHMLERALSAARKEIERRRLLELEQPDDVTDRITWIQPEVPRVSPRDLSSGPAAVQAAYRHALSSLRGSLGNRETGKPGNSTSKDDLSFVI